MKLNEILNKDNTIMTELYIDGEFETVTNADTIYYRYGELEFISMMMVGDVLVIEVTEPSHLTILS